jgi:hypothetical protein
MRALLLTALAAVLLLPATASATTAVPAPTETATSGNVSATFTHTDEGDGQWANSLTITRGGVQAYSGMPMLKDCADPYCAPDGVALNQPSVFATDLDGDGEPEVIVNLYTGGAHCCELAAVLRWTGNAYNVITHDFGDPGYRLVPGATSGDPAQFVSGDDRFAYEFAAFAYSALPIQIYRLDDGRFSDQTLSYRSQIVTDAARWKKAYMKIRRTRESLGVLAAYIADEYQLLRRSQADAFLSHELKAGRLKSLPGSGYPAGKAYIKLLKRELKAWGYAYTPGATL